MDHCWSSIRDDGHSKYLILHFVILDSIGLPELNELTSISFKTAREKIKPTESEFNYYFFENIPVLLINIFKKEREREKINS